MSYEVNDDFYKKAYNTADSDQKYEGIKFQLGELGKQQTGLDRYINSQQAGYSRALDQLEAAQLQTSQQNMREAQARGMVTTPGGTMQTDVATEAQRAQSYGTLAQEVSDQSVQLTQDQEDLDRDKAIAVQNSDFLANMVWDMGHNSTGMKRPGLLGGAAGLGAMFLPFIPGGKMAKAGGALFGGLAGNALFSKEYQIPEEWAGDIEDWLKDIYGDAYSPDTYKNFEDAFKSGFED